MTMPNWLLVLLAILVVLAVFGGVALYR